MPVITNGGVVLIALGVLIMVGTAVTLAFGPSLDWIQAVLMTVIFFIGFGTCLGGSEIKR